jgi:hypothetical protein
MNGTLYAVCVEMDYRVLEPIAFATTKEEIQKLHDEIVKRGWFCSGRFSNKYTLDGFQLSIEEYKLVDGMVTPQQ